MYGPNRGSMHGPPSGRCRKRCNEIIWVPVRSESFELVYCERSVLAFIKALAGTDKTIVPGWDI